MRSIIILILFAVTSISANHHIDNLSDDETDGWKLVLERGNLKVYKRSTKGTKFKELKLTTTLPAPLDEVMVALDDVERYPEWVFKCKKAKRIVTLSDSEFIYYTLSDFPAPLKDRDVILLSEQWYDAETKTMTTSSTIAHDYMKEIKVPKKVIRIPKFKSEWILKDKGDSTTDVVYQALVDPGGALPAWAVNMGIAKGPVKTIRGLKRLLKGKKD